MPERRIGQRLREIPDFPESIGGQRLQGPPKRHIHIGWDRLPDSRDREGRPQDELAEDLLGCPARIRGLTHEHLVEDARQREGVAGRSHGLVACGLLRRHVSWGPYAQAGFRQARPADPPEDEGDPEVGDQGLTLAEQDIVRLHIAMHHSRVMCRLESDVTVVPFVLGEIDRGHGALTKLTLDSVPACEGLVETGDGGKLAHRAR